MTVLMWIAVLVAVWFVASVVVALVVGRYLRRGSEGAGIHSDDAMRPLDTGPLRLWLAELPDRADLIRSGPRVPAPRAPRTAGPTTDTAAGTPAEATAVR